MRFDERLNRMLAYIHDHLDEQLDLGKLADIAYLSPYHCHRIYHALYGETIATTVKRLRLHRATGYLTQTSMTVREIASKSGYKNLESFTRIFGAVYGMPPAYYRKHGSHTQFQNYHRAQSSVSFDVTVKTIPEMSLLTVEHFGSYMQINKAFDTLYSCLGAKNLVQPGMRSIGVFYDDPASIPQKKLRSLAGVIVDEPFSVELPLGCTVISGGQYAVLKHKGPYANMQAAYHWLYGEWLVKSVKETAHAPVFEEYLNSPRTTLPTELLTDIYLPLT